MYTALDRRDDWFYSDYFGHLAGLVPEDCWRIACININRLPADFHSGDHSIFFQDIINYNLDVVLMQEVGLNWNEVGLEKNFQARLDAYMEPGHVDDSRIMGSGVSPSSRMRLEIDLPYPT